MEIEIRAKVADFEKMKTTLDERAEQKDIKEEYDTYLRHKDDPEPILIFRIRRKNDNAIFTLKGKAQGDDTAWPDFDFPLDNPDGLQGLLEKSMYTKVIEIKKKRSKYQLDGFEVNLDKIENLGNFIEIEGRGGEEERPKVEAKLTQTLKRLGVNENDIIRKGYVALMRENMGK